MPIIYCVEDDSNIRELIVYALSAAGFDVTGCNSGEDMRLLVEQQLPDLILLDIMLPQEDGLAILSALRQRTVTAGIPVILLTAKTAEYDKVIGLDSGADDYITKPFSVLELISRVKAILRRITPKSSKQLTYGEIILDRDKHLVLVSGQAVPLTVKEFDLLHYLIANTGLVLSREKIMDAVWGFDYEGETRTVDMHIKTLRQKLGAAGQDIATVRGVGYKIGH